MFRRFFSKATPFFIVILYLFVGCGTSSNLGSPIGDKVTEPRTQGWAALYRQNGQNIVQLYCGLKHDEREVSSSYSVDITVAGNMYHVTGDTLGVEKVTLVSDSHITLCGGYAIGARHFALPLALGSLI